MRKLLRANFARLMRDKIFWLCMLAMAAFGGFACYSRYDVMSRGFEATLDDVFYSSYPLLAILLAVFVCLFIGTEYSDGTMRNKLIVGSSRSAVYLSMFITSAAAGFLMTLSYVAVVSVCCIPLFGGLQSPLSTVMEMLGVGILVTLAFAAIYTLASMLVSNKTIVAILTLLCVIGAIMLGNGFLSRLEEPEFFEAMTMEADGTISTEQIRNPHFLTGEQREVWLLATDILPTAQCLRLAQRNVPTPYRMMLCSLAITILCTAAGLLFFRRKDLK